MRTTSRLIHTITVRIDAPASSSDVSAAVLWALRAIFKKCKTMWNETKFTKLTGCRYPIVQGPFGGGPSSVRLLSAVSNYGGIGSYGMHQVEPGEMRHLISQMKMATDRPFAVNLWLDDLELTAEEEEREIQKGLELLGHYFQDLGLQLPERPSRFLPKLDDQLEVILETRPPIFSFVYGIPTGTFLDACKARGILTMGTATTPYEAIELEHAGVDCVVASGPEAGGHRGSFLLKPEDSLVGTIALLPQVADAIRIPFIAAGGIADARGIAGAMALGAHGVQIGSAFLACQESDASQLHRSNLLSPMTGDTSLTRAFTGRLARGIRNLMSKDLDEKETTIPSYPIQSWLMAQLRPGAMARNRSDLVALSAGQGAPLIHHTNVADLMEELVREVPNVIARLHGSATA